MSFGPKFCKDVFILPILILFAPPEITIGKKINRNEKMAHAGFEPATFALLARRSNQLS